MVSFRKGSDFAEIGWVIDPATEASFIWEAPHQPALCETAPARQSSIWFPIRALHERLFEVCCPIDIHLRFGRDQKGDPGMVGIDGEMSSIRPDKLNKLLMPMHPAEWRTPNRPMLQLMMPYLFVADEPVYLKMLPPVGSYQRPIPGLMLGGRFPIHIWPRELIWAFEWHDTSKDLIVNRGDPLFCVGFETEDPARPVRLVEAELTPELREYTAGIRGVSGYVNRTYALFNTARQRRPKKLVVPKAR